MMPVIEFGVTLFGVPCNKAENEKERQNENTNCIAGVGNDICCRTNL
jgi:hypothetical protein